MQFVGDAVMAVFGAPFPQPDHADRSVAAAAAMHAAQAEVNAGWATRGLPPFILGIGVSTGTAAAALLGSEERLEYTLVGDTVNMAQRLCDLARPGDCTVVSEATWAALPIRPAGTRLDAVLVKGREALVTAWMLGPAIEARPVEALPSLPAVEARHGGSQ
jgi:class 3 adenylate cyclase